MLPGYLKGYIHSAGQAEITPTGRFEGLKLLKKDIKKQEKTAKIFKAVIFSGPVAPSLLNLLSFYSLPSQQ